MHTIRRVCRTTLAFTLVLACLSIGLGAAQPRSFQFDIQDQSLSQALQSYGRISGQQIVFTEELVAGRVSPSLKGEFAAEAALEHLLQGSGLVAERSPSGVLMIQRRLPLRVPEVPALETRTPSGSSSHKEPQEPLIPGAGADVSGGPGSAAS